MGFDELLLYEEQNGKLDELCQTHRLLWNFDRNSYPLTLTIRPENPYAGQLSMMGGEDEAGAGKASMTWVYQNGVLTTTTRGTFTISKTVRDKIESTLTKMISFWLQHFFRSMVESGRLRGKTEPEVDAPPLDLPDDEDEPGGGA